jgi:hydroxymethylglutaryl-CoA lyase
MMCNQMGYNTGIDMFKLLDASDLAVQLTQTARGGNAKAWLRKHYPAPS